MLGEKFFFVSEGKWMHAWVNSACKWIHELMHIHISFQMQSNASLIIQFMARSERTNGMKYAKERGQRKREMAIE